MAEDDFPGKDTEPWPDYPELPEFPPGMPMEFNKFYFDLSLMHQQAARHYQDLRHKFLNQQQGMMGLHRRLESLETQGSALEKTVAQWKAYIVALTAAGGILAFLSGVARNVVGWLK